ncbi:MAG TPA: hypothetical protein VFG10_05925 [Saprospiraceae bacterium]|nr:hypothetical protein [Saprospiraceae bacterium]
MFLFTQSASAQISGTKNIPGDYATLAAAITDLNIQGVGAGGVILNLISGNPETAPAGGYVIGGTGSLVLTTSSVANPITIQGNSNTITANATLTVGALTDAIFKLIGADWVTITGFIMQENAANTIASPASSNNMTEWGVALLYVSVTDGSQNNTIQGNTISLNKTYTNTWGIYSNTRHSSTAIATTADITNSTTAPNKNNKVYGNTISNVNMGIALIGSGTAANQDTGNDIGGASGATGNIISNWGGAAAVSGYISNSGTSYCIFVNHQVGDNISFNTITSATISGTAVTLRGIFKDYTTTSASLSGITNITNNTITINDNFTSGALECIRTQGTVVSGSTFNINSNNILNTTVGGASSSTLLVGIVNSSAPGTLNMNSNVLRGNTSTATSGGFTGISNTGSVVTAINMNSNQIGNAGGGAITFSAATSGAVLALNCSGGASTCTTTIQSNDIRGIVHSVAGSSTHTYILSTGTPLSLNVNNNTFTNLNVSTTGSATFLSHSYSMPAGGTQTFNNNSIVTAYNKGSVGGTVFISTTNGSTPNGTTSSMTNNNFSNITVTGATGITGINNTDGFSTSAAKVCTGNTFNNWTGGTGAILCINYGYIGATTSNISNNIITNITGQAAITGINIGSSFSGATTLHIANNTLTNLTSTGTGGAVIGIICTNVSTTININNNVISTLASTGAVAVTGISIGGATTTNVFKNNIYDLLGTNASSTVSGLIISTGTTINASNNLIGDLRATAANAANPLIGISITGGTTVNAYYNTVYLNGISSGALFGSSAISVSTTPTVTLRNNIFYNTSSVTGAGLAVAYRRSGTTLTSYGSASNNNDFFATTIFTDGTNTDVGIAAYKTRVAPRDAASFFEDPEFQSIVGSNANFLKYKISSAKQVESGAVNISGVTDDYFGTVRFGNPGYITCVPASGAPDVGAWELCGILADFNGPSISYSLLGASSCTSTRTISGVTIIDASNVNTTAGTRPRIYYKKTTDANDLTGWKFFEATGLGGSPFSFDIDYTLLNAGSVTTGDVIQYFIVAQDLASTPNVAINSGIFNSTAASVALVAGNFPITGTINSYTIITAGLTGVVNVGTAQTIKSLTETGPATGLFATINTNGLSGPTTIVLMDPTITETGAIALNAINYNGCAAGPYTLTIKPNTSTVLTGSVGTGAVLKLNGADNVTIDGSNNGSSSRNLTIANTTTTTSGNAVVWLASPATGNGATNNTIKNCIIEGNAALTTFLGMYVGGSTTISLTAAGNELNSNNTISNNLFRKTQFGLALFGFATVSPDLNNIVSNNSFGTDAAGEGFSLGGINADRQQNLIVSGNEIQNITNATTSANVFGIRLLDFKNGLAFNNKIHDMVYTGASTAKFYGIGLTSSSYTTIGNPSNAQVYNNIVYKMNSSGTSATWNLTGILAGAGYGDKYYFNSVHLTGQLANSSTGLVAAFANGDLNLTATCTNIDVRNNSFSLTGSSATAGGNFWAYFTQATSMTGSTLNYNDLFCNGTGATNNVGRLNSVNYPTLSAWQIITGQEANSISSDPIYNSASNLVPQIGSPLVLAGTNIPGITTDLIGTTRHATMPTIGAYETAGDAASPTIVYTALVATCSTGDRMITATLTDASGVATSGNSPRIYYKKNVGGTWFSQPGSLSSGTVTNGTWTFTIVAADMGGVASGNTIYYYVIAQDVLGNVGSNPSSGLVAGNVNAVTTPPSSPNTYNIQSTLSGGTYTVGVGGAYTTLTAAVAAYNSSCLTGTIIFNLIDATYPSETFPITINANTDANATNTLTIKPTLTGTTITGSSATALITLNGADYITIDGSIGSTSNTVCPVSAATRDLTITNSNTATTSGIVWLATAGGTDGATNNTIRNCNLTGNSPTQTIVGLGSGGTTVGTAGAGNINNKYINNRISKVQFGIYSGGASTSNYNTGTIISQNTLNVSPPNNIRVMGIFVTFDNGVQITGNSIGKISGSGGDAAAISLGSNNYATSTTTGADVINALVSKNVIDSIRASSTFSAIGIGVVQTTSGINEISNNMINNVLTNGTSGDFGASIFVAGGTGGTTRIYYNTISMAATTTGGSYDNFGLAIGGSNPIVDIKNNILVNTTTSGSGFSYALGLGYSTFTNLSSNNNDLYTAGAASKFVRTGSLLNASGTDYLTLPAWQVASGNDASSLNMLPVFMSSTNLHIDGTNPANLPLDNAAITLASVTDDIDCDVRMTDIGADEFMPPPCASAVGGTAAITGPSTFCGSGSPTITASGYSTGSGSGYQWMTSTNSGDYPASGTAVSGQTNPATLVTGSVTVTRHYWLRVTCPSGTTTAYSNMLTITITPSSAIISGPTTKCTADPAIMLNETGGTGISWLWSTTETTQTITVNPGSTTTYSVTVTSGGSCTAVATRTIAVIPNPTGVTAMASINPVCSGVPFNLSSTFTPLSSTILSEGFESGAAGWAFEDSSSTGIALAQQIFHIQASPYTDATGSATFSNFSISGSNFAYTNADAGGSGSQTRTNLVSPSFSTVGYTGSGTLTFKHGYKYWSTSTPPERVEVQISTNGGSSWTNLSNYQGADVGVTTNNLQTTVTATVTVPAIYMGLSNVKLRFRYRSNFGYYWVIDDVLLTSSVPAPTFAWSSSPGGFTSSLQNPTGVTESVPTNYTVTVTNGGGCQAQASTGIVGVNPLPSISLGVDPSVCAGITSANLTYSATTGGPDQYSIDYNAAANTAGFVDVVNASLPATPILLTVPGGAPAGTYLATLSVRNSATTCSSSSSAISVTINASPTITLGTNPTVCSGTTSANLSYSGTTGTPDQYSIDYDAAAEAQGFADVTLASLPASPIVLTVPGGAALATYNATLSVRNSTTTCSGSGSAITVTVAPSPTITLGTNPSVCSGVTTADLSYSGTTGTPNQYSIDYDAAAEAQGFVDVTLASLPASPITLTVPGGAATGTYNATLSVRNSSTTCSDAGSAITVTVGPSPTISLGANPAVCGGVTTANLSYSGTTGTPDQYSIDYDAAAEAEGFADVTLASLPASPITLTVPGGAANGVYNATLSVRNSTSTCSSAGSAITVTVGASPTITLGTNPTVCSWVTTADLSYSATTGSPDQYSIDYDATAEAQGFVDVTLASLTSTPIVLTLPGGAIPATYNATLTVRNSSTTCSSTSSSITVTISPAIVMNASDAGAGSLRDLIACVGSGATITFDASIWNSTILLTTGPILINKNIIISGPTGLDFISISANGTPPVFNITSGNLEFAPNGNVNIMQ